MTSKITLQIKVSDPSHLDSLCLELRQLGVKGPDDSFKLEKSRVSYVWVNELYLRSSKAGKETWDTNYIGRYRQSIGYCRSLNEHPLGETRNLIWPEDKTEILKIVEQEFGKLSSELRKIKEEIHGNIF